MPIPDDEAVVTLPHVPREQTDSLDDAEQRLTRDAESLEAQAQRLREIVDNIRAARKMRGHVVDIPGVKHGEYKGMRPADALESYLRTRKDMKITLAQAVADLITGGVDPGQPRRGQTDPAALISHTLKISLPNRTQTFDWSPKGLLKGIPDEKIFLRLAESAYVPRRRKRTNNGAA